MTLPTNIVNGQAGHAGLHNDTNTQVNTNTTDIANRALLTGPFSPTITGAAQGGRFVGFTDLNVSGGAPQSGTFQEGDFVIAHHSGFNYCRLLVCYTAGSPGSWTDSIMPMSNSVALALGTASPGSGSQPSRSDHVHPTTGLVTQAQVTAKGDLLAASASGTVTNLAVGADGKAPVADSSASAGLSYKDKSFFSQFPPFEVEVGGYLASASSGSTGTANAYTTGRMYLEPIDICKTMTFDRVGTSITATGSGSGQVIRLGLYADDGTFSRPSGAALYDWGTVDPTSGTGDKLITINQQLSPGRYWLAWAIQGTVSSSPTVVTNNIVNQAGLGNLGNNSNRVWGMSGVSGALPTISGLFRDSNPPMIGVRRSA
jgi:hypothetical protein